MSQALDEFIEWFDQLTLKERIQIVRYVCNRRRRTANFDGFYVGPAPTQQSNPCPTCGKPL